MESKLKNYPEAWVPMSELHRVQRARAVELAVFLMALATMAILR